MKKSGISRGFTKLLDIISESFFRRIRINQRLFITFIVLSIIPLSITGYVSIQSSIKAMEENISSYSIQILTQNKYNLTNEIRKLEDISMEIMLSEEMANYDKSIRKKDDIAKLQALKQLESLFEYKLSGYDSISSMGFYPIDCDIVAKTEVLINNANSSKDGIFNLIVNTKGQPVWIYMKNKESELGIDTDLEYSGHDSLRVQTPVLFRKMSSMVDAQVLGVLHIAPEKEVLRKIVSEINIGKDGSVILLDSDNKVLTSVEEELIGNRIYQEIDNRLRGLEHSTGYFFVELSNINTLVCYSVIEETGWKVLSMVPFKNLTMRIDKITVFVFILVLSCILIALVVSYLVTRSVSLPISRINETVEYLGRGDFSRKLDVKYNDELSNFSRGFNKMIDDMQNLINEVYITKIQKLDSDFRALQAQINPHFLYNTLETINSLALIKKEWEISEMIRGLASIFRYSIKNDNASICLRDEIEHVKLYVLLLALTYEDKIKIEYCINQELMEAKVLKFILQPLVENAIIHGIEKTNRKGIIRIEARSDGNQMYIIVSDNGNGIDKHQLNKVRTKLMEAAKDNNESKQAASSIGLINIHSRIRLHFGENYGLNVDSTPGTGTVVTINIPLIL